MAHILVCDDDQSIRDSLELFLSKRGHQPCLASNGLEAIEEVARCSPELLLLDLKMPGMDGFDVLRQVRQSNPHLQVIVITAHDDMRSTIEASRLGAFDFVPKPVDLQLLDKTICKAIECNCALVNDEHITIPDGELIGDRLQLIGKSPQMRYIYQQIGRVANSQVTVLIQGESGTGKELIARVIHRSSLNGKQPFVAVNCGAVSEGLLESELFGHVRGSFTGAVRNKKGKFELAGNGTILLDEISNTSPAMQAKLLRVLQEREFDPVGGEATLPLQARVIAATNCNLEDLVASNHFRQDLLYRLNVYPIHIPPLRDRREDIEQLVMYYLRHFRERYKSGIQKISREAFRRLNEFDWPGNVRQLEHILLNAVLHNSGEVLTEEALAFPVRHESAHLMHHVDDDLSLTQIEKRHIELVLKSVQWNKHEACRVLGISKPTLYSKIREYGLLQSDIAW